MLVLQRERDQRIMIGNGIVITIVDIRCHGKKPKVRIGIDAPPEVPVHREEIFEAIQAGPPIDIRRHAERGGLCGPVADVDGEGVE